MVKSLKKRLKEYGEDWTVIPKEEFEEEVEAAKYSSVKMYIKVKDEKPDDCNI